MTIRLVAVLAMAATALTLSGCAGTPSPTQMVTVAASPTQPADTPSTSPESSSPEATPEESVSQETPSAAAETFVMPKVVGMVLQTAQDLLQSKGSFLMDQEDASGLGRFQVDDSNWKVCTQKPKAGSKVPTETVVVLAAVKLSEKCP